MLQQILQPLPLVLVIIIIIMAAALLRLKRILKQQTNPNQSAQNHAQMETQVQSTLRANEADQRFLSKADEALRLTQTFQKFVPRQFVEHFAKHGSDTLELGRADEDEVAILFSDIRGFTGLSEKMTPQELMKFLNSYFLRMNDPIHQNGGFIDKFIGDAIMALFDHPKGTNRDKAIDALNAAVDLRYALNVYNQHRHNSGYPPINIGVGIHFGPVIIGTVGSDDRMDTTVIGDSVNIAYRLESLAPKLGADIIVSSQLLETAAAKEKFSYRFLDWVRVKGRKNPVEVYEILNHLPEETIALRKKTAPWIEKGVEHRKSQQWDEALNCFEKARMLNPDDHLVAHHIAQCHSIKSSLVSLDWDGAADL